MHILIRSTLSCTGSFQVKKVSELSSPLVDTVTQSLRLITKGTPTFNKQKHLHLDLQTYTKFISEGTSYHQNCHTHFMQPEIFEDFCALWLYERHQGSPKCTLPKFWCNDHQGFWSRAQFKRPWSKNFQSSGESLKQDLALYLTHFEGGRWGSRTLTVRIPAHQQV